MGQNECVFSLSFLHKGDIIHLKIARNSKDKYYLKVDDDHKFISIDTLVAFYQTNVLPQTAIKLKRPLAMEIPFPANFFEKENLAKQETMLRKRQVA